MQFQAFNKILLEDQKIQRYTVDGVDLGYQFRIRYVAMCRRIVGDSICTE